MSSNGGEDALLVWVQSFPNSATVETLPDLATGTPLAKICAKIDPAHFTAEWISRLTKTSRDNRQICQLNSNKVVEKVMEYYTQCLQLNILGFDLPDGDRVGEGDMESISILVQLILGAAVNCENKNDFIGSLMALDEFVQAELMNFIQVILDACVPVGQTPELLSEDDLKQRLYEIEKELALAAEENSALRSDLESAKQFIAEREKGDGNGELDLVERRALEVQRRLEEAQEEMIMFEHQREDDKIRLDVSLREADEWRQRAEMAEQKADEAAMLKDEVDYLREKADKATRLQASLENFKKKAEESGELKTQLRDMEDHVESMRIEKEEESRKSKSYKTQVQTSKQQLLETQSKALEDQRKAEKYEAEFRLLTERAKVAEAASERANAELMSIRELNEELSLGGGNITNLGGGDSLAAEAADGEDLSLMPPQVKEIMIRLQSENKLLKEQSERELNRYTVDKGELRDQVDTLSMEKQIFSDRVAKLEMQVFNGTSAGEENTEEIQELQDRLQKAKEDDSTKKEEIQTLSQSLNDTKEKGEEFEALLKQKEEDIKAMETRYRSYLEKARSVIKTLDPKHNNNTEAVALRAQIIEKDRRIRRLEAESKEKGKSRDQEEKLLVSAWYQLGNKSSRGAVEERVGRSQPGQSFLARQRQQTQQRRNQARSVQSSQKSRHIPGGNTGGNTRKDATGGSGLFSR